MREIFDVWVNVYPPMPATYQNAFGNTLTAHETREDALNNAGHSCLATCLLRFDGEQLKPDVNQELVEALTYIDNLENEMPKKGWSKLAFAEHQLALAQNCAEQAIAKHKAGDSPVEPKAEMLDAAANAIEELSRKDKPC